MKISQEKMNRVVLFVGIVFFLGCVNPKQDNNLSEDKKETLLTAINQFNEAFAKGDMTTLESMITENYLHTNGTSKSIVKQDWLNYLKKRTLDIESGIVETVNYEMDEVSFEFYGNTAVVTARITTGVKRNDSIFNNQYRVTHLWVNEEGQWKRAGFHDSKIK
nr:nuclear transport factor 2 family protein [Allomuricauda sp.]